ncbi:type II toxin-antitoxin system VapC family toxin [Sulfurimonas sp. SAG-AH-194-C21]|nr:type II toxin-antitoxin system VapC family toxin [Sulfurimonas sp. SAG-AH-194-C21]MDF1883632.1 type II toxin-antitoxin system VapC family toxin [Sulfurimonas sp. SAG-AH-194-C21]
MRYLLDTNIISEFISTKPNENVQKFILTLKEEDLFLSVITIGEIKFGIEKLEDGKKKVSLLHWLENDLLQRFNNKILPINVNVMLKWGALNQELKKLGKPLPLMDSIIGATCQEFEMTLITRNEKDFKNISIEIINPF